MHSLTNLNAYGETSLELVDQRPAKVVFDLIPPLYAQDDFRFINVSGDYKYYPEPGIEITEIINYDICLPTVRIAIQSPYNQFIMNSTISWNSALPSHLAVTEVNKVYTISGLRDVNDWNRVKNFVWTLFGGYSTVPLWFLEVSINYYDQETNSMSARSWYVADPRNYYRAKLASEFTSTNKLSRIRTIRKALTVITTVECETQPGKQGKANIVSTATMNVSAAEIVLRSKASVSILGRIARLGNANLSSQVTVYARPYDFDKAQANITTTTTLNCTVNTDLLTVYRVTAIENFDNAPTVSGSNLVIEWGDGTITNVGTVSNQLVTHTYLNTQPKTVDVTIRGSLTQFSYQQTDTYVAKLLEILTLNSGLNSLRISSQPEFTKITGKLPSTVTSLSNCFSDCDAFNDSNVVNWDTGNISNMTNVLSGCATFSQDLSGWDVHLIPTKPTHFGLNSPNFPTSKHPVWGTYGS